jgi:hypothetical protein
MFYEQIFVQNLIYNIIYRYKNVQQALLQNVRNFAWVLSS